MSKTLARFTFLLLATSALVACSSSNSAAPADGGGVALDGGGTATDGGTTTDGGGADAGCTEAACSTQVGGDYTICADCGQFSGITIGQVGPLNGTLANTCGCAIKGCVETDGGEQCGTGTVDPAADGGPLLSAQFVISYMTINVPADCKGHYLDGGVPDLVCTGEGFAVTCNGAIKPNFGGTCP